MKMKQICVAGLMACLLALCVNTARGGEVISLTIGGGHPSNTMAYTSVCQSFFQTEISKRTAERTDYEVEWVEAYGGTIAKLGEALLATQDGLIDVMCSAYGFDSNKLFLMNLPYYVPFSSSDPRIANAACRATYNAFKETYDELWARYNQKFLAFGPSGRYELITNFPVNSMEDLKGHKIAAAGANLLWLDGTGAIPVQSNLNEAYTSIQTGVYDGWVMWPDSSDRFKLYEVAPYYTMVGFGACPAHGISINLDTWNDLPGEVQAIVEEVSLEYDKLVGQVAWEWDQVALENMKEKGVTVTTLDPEVVKNWVAGLQEVPGLRSAEARDSLGFANAVDIWKTYIKSQESLGHVYPRTWKFDE